MNLGILWECDFIENFEGSDVIWLEYAKFMSQKKLPDKPEIVEAE